jgi:serine/threonine protein kinase
MSEKILREIRIGSKVSESQYIVQYKTSWTENINDDNEWVTQDVVSNNTLQTNSVIDISPLSGHILYIQMELCRMTLKAAISKIHFELNQDFGKPLTVVGAYIASLFFDEILSGVHYLHSLSPPIIHRDLKPQNIFITDGKCGNFIKIGDFGTATIHETMTMHVNGDASDFDSVFNPSNLLINHTKNRGTVGYMAPEVFNGEPYNEKCDIYSLGRIMMDLCCVEFDSHIDPIS